MGMPGAASASKNDLQPRHGLTLLFSIQKESSQDKQNFTETGMILKWGKKAVTEEKNLEISYRKNKYIEKLIGNINQKLRILPKLRFTCLKNSDRISL